MAAAALAGAMAGCAPRSGWEPIGRVCAAQAPAVVCLDAQPDQPLELRFADVVVLPSECVQADEVKGGRIAAELFDGRGTSRRVRFGARPGRRTVVSVDGQGQIDVGRSRCDSTAF